MARSTAWVSVLVLSSVAVLAVAGCAGRAAVIGGDDDGGRGNDAAPTPTPDGGGIGDAASPTACPSALPFEGSPCTRPGLQCEYGNDVSPICNRTATCDQVRGWAVSVPTPGHQCPTPAPVTGGDCPGSREAARGQSCAVRGEICGYANGRCACEEPFGPVRMDASTQLTWTCESPAPGCPQPRPRIGSACASEGLTCDYGACSFPSGMALQCTGGAWQSAPVGCPANAG